MLSMSSNDLVIAQLNGSLEALGHLLWNFRLAIHLKCSQCFCHTIALAINPFIKLYELKLLILKILDLIFLHKV